MAEQQARQVLSRLLADCLGWQRDHAKFEALRAEKWMDSALAAYIEHGAARLVSRNGNSFKAFPTLTGRAR
jgi:hypothetical protein